MILKKGSLHYNTVIKSDEVEKIKVLGKPGYSQVQVCKLSTIWLSISYFK